MGTKTFDEAEAEALAVIPSGKKLKDMPFMKESAREKKAPASATESAYGLLSSLVSKRAGPECAPAHEVRIVGGEAAADAFSYLLDNALGNPPGSKFHRERSYNEQAAQIDRSIAELSKEEKVAILDLKPFGKVTSARYMFPAGCADLDSKRKPSRLMQAVARVKRDEMRISKSSNPKYDGHGVGETFDVEGGVARMNKAESSFESFINSDPNEMLAGNDSVFKSWPADSEYHRNRTAILRVSCAMTYTSIHDCHPGAESWEKAKAYAERHKINKKPIPSVIVTAEDYEAVAEFLGNIKYWELADYSLHCTKTEDGRYLSGSRWLLHMRAGMNQAFLDYYKLNK